MASIILPGSASPSNVLSGQTFSAGSNFNTAGTMINNGAATLTPSGTGTVAIPAGYHNGSGVVSQVSVPAANVLTGTTIAGVAGTMANRGAVTITPSTANQSISAGYHNGSGIVQGDVNLVAGNILSGKSIFGISGNVVAGRPIATGTLTAVVQGSTGNTVSGLAFTPTYVYLHYNWGHPTYEMWVIASKGTISGTTFETINSSSSSAPRWTATNSSDQGSSNLTISVNSFSFTMGNGSYSGTGSSFSRDVNWFAIG